MGINVQPLLAVGGVSGIAIGFGAQSVSANAITGINLVSLWSDLYGTVHAYHMYHQTLYPMHKSCNGTMSPVQQHSRCLQAHLFDSATLLSEEHLNSEF